MINLIFYLPFVCFRFFFSFHSNNKTIPSALYVRTINIQSISRCNALVIFSLLCFGNNNCFQQQQKNTTIETQRCVINDCSFHASFERICFMPVTSVHEHFELYRADGTDFHCMRFLQHNTPKTIYPMLYVGVSSKPGVCLPTANRIFRSGNGFT